MTIRALIVDDEEEIVRTVGDIVRTLGHDYHSAGDIETARKCLKAAPYDYLILDMNIPVAPDRLTRRRENGRNFVATIRSMDGLATLPIIAITGHDRGESDFILSVMRAGGMAFTQYVQKPIDGDKLDKAIRESLSKGDPQLAGSSVGRKARNDALEPFRAKQREMVIHEDYVTICGVTVWQDRGQPDMRRILLALNKMDRGRYVRINGTRLGKALDRNASNPVSRPIKDFRDRARAVMTSECGLECGSQDIIASGSGGYHFTEWMVVREAGADAQRAEQVRQPEKDDGLNERQRKILEAIDSGAELRQKDVIAMFRRNWNQSTVKRDIKGLREAGLIETPPDGYYVRRHE